jgi:hypothetical protein
MSPGLAAFFGVIIGSAISGVSLILTDWFKHCRKRKELIQDILVPKKIESYNKLLNMAIELREELPLYQTGIEVLRWPKDKRISPKYSKNEGDKNLKKEKDDAKKIYQKIDELRKYMLNHVVILANDVQLVFWENFSEFVSWRNRFCIYTDEQLNKMVPDHLEKCFNSLNVLLENTKKAIVKDLNIQEFDFPSIEELKDSRQKGKNLKKEFQNFCDFSRLLRTILH